MNNVIAAPRLTLRPLQLSDVKPLQSIFGDPDVMRYSLSGVLTLPQIEERVNMAITAQREEGLIHYGVVENTTGVLIGFCGFKKSVIDAQEYVEVIYRYAKSSWGNGYATEALKAMLMHALPSDRVIAIIEPANSASVRVAQKAGMKVWKETDYHGYHVQIFVYERAE